MRRLLLVAALGLGCTKAPPAATPAPVIQGPRATIEPAVPAPHLRIIGTNDFHGALEPRPDDRGMMRGGAAWVASAIAQARHECVAPDCFSVLVDGGDMYQGTAASNFVFGRSVVGIYNYDGYAAAAVGNHEFDWGQDTLRSIMRAAHFSIMAANVRYKDGRDVPWIPNDTLIKRGPFTIGVIGVATQETPVTTMAANVADLTFADPVPIIDSIAPTLRARGADFVVVLGHIGARCDSTCSGEAADIAGRVTAKIDAIISGHSHTFVNSEVRGIPLVQARARGQALEVVDLYKTASAHHEVREIYTDSIQPNADVQALVRDANSWLDKVAPQINKPVAQIATVLRNSGNQNALGNLIADAMRVVGGGDIAIMNSGGIRQSLPAGTATYATLFEVQPFGNKLMRVRVSGFDLRQYFASRLARGNPNFHISGVRVVYHTGSTPGIDSLTINGKPLVDSNVYTVVLNDFSAGGGDKLGFGAAAVSTTPADIVDLDALIAYLGSLPQPVVAPAEPRLILKP